MPLLRMSCAVLLDPHRSQCKDKRLIGGKEIGYCEFKYDDENRFPSGQKVQLRNHPVDHSWGKVKATLDLDITVTWE